MMADKIFGSSYHVIKPLSLVFRIYGRPHRRAEDVAVAHYRGGPTVVLWTELPDLIARRQIARVGL